MSPSVGYDVACDERCGIDVDTELRDGIMATFVTALNAMGEAFTEDFAKHGLEQAVEMFKDHVAEHNAEHGSWIDASGAEQPAGMIWAAAGLLMGAFINMGVWHE